MKLLPDRLPNPPIQYLQQQFNQIIRKIDQALKQEVQSQTDADDREAQDWFLSK